ncbi:MAG: large subunit ribosomal protein [Chloroflexota bacterium]|jgi:large subunit ribosomal protein L23|nr:large subunit ribosomal protein [Chloroflexota bacterium]
MDAHDVLRRPVVTEKSTMLSELGQYVFEVARAANKIEVRRAVEEIFKVHVEAVNIVNVHPYERRMMMGKSKGMTAAKKKAIVKLRPGERIELFEGV